MKKLPLLVFASLLLGGFDAIAQEPEKKFGISFSGFVKYDAFYDTRQVSSIREGHFLVVPLNISKDSVGKDINAKPSFNMLSIQSRLTGKITGPDAFGAKTSGILEADFFGNENSNFSDVNGFRLRHAIVKLNWTNTELLMGQFWHPLFVHTCFPGTISFNTGVPFQPFSRNPQIRLTQKFGGISFMVAALSQRDFTSPGGSSLALRNSGIPEVQGQLSFAMKNDSAQTEFLAGVGGGYKTIVPRLQTKWKNKIYSLDEKLSGFSAEVFFKVKVPVLTVKAEAVFGQNLFDHVLLGGYAPSTIADSATGKIDYTNFSTLTCWADINTNGKKFQFGVFGGLALNKGTDKDIMSGSDLSATARGSNIKQVIRVSPRFVFISGKVQLATEIEHTIAAYGSFDIGEKRGKVSNTKDVSNTRILFSAIYSF